jgi:hypothetical protein
MAEDGPIPFHYPLKELPGGGYEARTLANVNDSDAVVILHPGKPEGGTLLSLQYARLSDRNCLLLDLSSLEPESAAVLLGEFLLEHRPLRVNISGPRASEWAFAYSSCLRLLECCFGR